MTEANDEQTKADAASRAGAAPGSMEASIARLEKQVALLVEQQGDVIRALALIAERLQAAPAAPGAAAAPPAAGAELPATALPVHEIARRLLDAGKLREAEVLLQQALETNPRLPVIHTLLGRVYRAMRRPADAKKHFLEALAIDWRAPARGHLGELLVAAGKLDEALALWDAAHRSDPANAQPLRECLSLALQAKRVDLAETYAHRHAAQSCSTRFWPERRGDDPPFSNTTHLLKAPKLRHDIEQLDYLIERGVVDAAQFAPIVEGYRAALERIAPMGDVARVPMTDAERATIGRVFGRIVHVTPAARVAKALSYDWDMAAIERRYIDNPPGIITIDRLLSDDALASLRRFCIESTIWSTTRYDNGYLGSFMADGFATPLLTQIADELRAAMPRVIGDRPLTTMWGFKYDQQMDGINLHADVAAVNVNFWITPDDANLDPESGGLVVYDAEAPQEWGFSMYNAGRSNAEIQAWLDRVGARAVDFPHRENRAVIFNSDLFHRTAPFRFKPGYANRRINVTMLFGYRTDQRLEVGRADDAK